MSLSYINETLHPHVFAEKSQHCYKTQLQPQWKSRTAGNKRRFCHNVMKTLEPLQHRSKQSEGDSTQGPHWGLLSHLHISATLSHCVLVFLCFPPLFIGQISSKTMSSRKNKTKENQNWKPPTDAFIPKGLVGFPLAYIWLKKVTFTPGKNLCHKHLNCNYFCQFTAFRKTAACCLLFPFLSGINCE